MSNRLPSVGALFALLACGLVTSPARAWNGTGHQVVSQIAWQNLRPDTQKKIAHLIIDKHPYFKRHLRPTDLAPDSAEYAMRAFMLASTWPDLLRTTRDPKERQHHRAEWHYVNIPIIPEGTDPAAIQVPAIELKFHADKPVTNIVQALHWCTRRLKDPQAPDEEKAIVLAWILHLAGDLHQPLHATAVYSADYPAGDRGGNLFIVKYHGNITDLHSFWDEILGRYVAPRLLTAITEKIIEQHPRQTLADQLKTTEFADWAQESFALARDVTYQGQKLKGITKAASVADKTGDTVPELPQGYDEKAREVARARIALAGHRLADLLNRAFE